MSDTYQTISGPNEGEFRDRGSKFFAYAYPVYDENAWQEKLDNLQKTHFKARHHCYAYRLGLDGNNFRANDDGEPSGTAGRPILGQIDSFQLTNVIVIVVRYFGGTKLGTSGLITAYKTAACNALENATIIEKTVEDIYHLTFSYARMSQVMNAVKKQQLQIVEQDFGDSGNLFIAIRQSEVHDQLRRIRAQVAEVHLEEIDSIETIEGFTLAYVRTR